MATNVYDDEMFFSAYANLPRSQKGLQAAPEWPELQRMIDGVEGKRVLDLGCGYGWFCRWATQAGASSVQGVDLSEKMIARARESPPTDGITYRIGDISSIVIDKSSYELIYSSLALHYLSSLEGLFKNVFEGLVPSGKFVFSVEHPVWTAATGWFIKSDDGPPIWPLNTYSDEGGREKTWLGSKVLKFHRRLDTYVKLLLKAGFVLRDMTEWMPSPVDLKEHPEWVDEVHRPMFLLVEVQKPGA